MNFKAIDNLRRIVAEATGEPFVGINDPALSLLVPHVEGFDQEAETASLHGRFAPRQLVAQRNRTGDILRVGLVERDDDPLHSDAERDVAVISLGIMNPDNRGSRVKMAGRELSSPTAEELIAFLGI